MKMPVTEALIPELRRLPTYKERVEALHAIRPHQAVVGAAMLAGILAGAVVAYRMLALLGAYGDWMIILGTATLSSLGAAVALLALAFWYHRRGRRKLRAYLAERGCPICLACGYDLTGNISGRCPECGTPTPAPPG